MRVITITQHGTCRNAAGPFRCVPSRTVIRRRLNGAAPNARSEPAATRPLLLTVSNPANPEILAEYYTFGFDQAKNVTELFDSSGNIAASYDYAPFGATLSAAGPAAAPNPFRFSSEVWDATLGLVDYTFRPYNPLDGRFTTRDPIEEDGGLNLYGFVGNDPVNKTDYLRLAFWDECCNGKKYNKILHCCQKDTVWSRFEKIPTGVKICVARARDWKVKDHKWLETPYGNVGMAPTGSMFGSGGSDITTDSYVVRRDKKCEEVAISPCLYDVEKFLEAVSSQVWMYTNTPSAWWYALGISDCRHFVDDVIDYAKEKSRY